MKSARSAAWLAAIAYPAALASSPGRMPSDSKLYLYLDPAGLLGRATQTWDTSQYAGFVPHQQIAYLWPAGPWFWLMDRIGVPDWIAHRLWIATLLFLAGAGVMWLARSLGLGARPALAAGAIYMLSPYVLAYVSRTSVMLLPWAGLGWIVALALRSAREGGWRAPALLALVVLTVGSTNATSLVMIAPAPVLLLVHVVLAREVTARAAVAAAARSAALCTAVSLWWVVMLVVQGRYGADVLAYTETLEAVSSTSTAPEAVRGLGYWLNYIRDQVQATTTAAADYHTWVWLVAVGFALVLVGVVGIAFTSWHHRRFAAWSVLAGMVLGVGVYPIDRPAPLFSGLGEHSRSTLALALRSSTRALPVAVLGLALGAGALLATLRPDRRRLAGTVAVIGLALLNLPALWTGRLVDPSLERDQQPPTAWTDAAAALTAGDLDARVLQLPGAEFGAFRWGYTVDPPLPGLTGKPLLTRDLQPLGSAGAMDLLYALDDRFQMGIVEPAAIAPVARLLGADTIWVAGDMAFERFRTPRPELTEGLFRAGVDGLGEPVAYGTPEPNDAAVPMIDEQSISDPRIGAPVTPVLLVPVDDPVGVVRGKTTTVVLSGSGAGVVDASAAGLLSGDEAVLYSASLDAADLARWIDTAAMVVVTDSNRDRAQQWRGSQDVHGFTEAGGPDPGVGTFDSQDQRLPVFPGVRVDQQTIAVQEGPVVALASAYGHPLGYWPEHRAAMAVDGDPLTAWRVAARSNPLGEWIELTAGEAVDEVTLTQPDGDRRITSIEVQVDGRPGQVVDVAAEAPTTFRLGAPADRMRIVIRAVTAGMSGVGFAEADLGLGPTREVTVLPADALAAVDGRPLAIILTRERVRATDRDRTDPDVSLVRRFGLAGEQLFDLTVTARLDVRATDDTLIELIGAPAASAGSTLAGAPQHRPWAAVDGDTRTTWISAMGDPVGTWLKVEPAPDATTALIVQPERDDLARITSVRLERDGSVADATLDASTTAVSLPAGRGPLTITVLATDGTTTVDRETGTVIGLPVGIAEIDAPGLGSAPATTVDTGCRDDLLALDGRPIALRLSGATADALAGEPLTVELCDPGPLRLGRGDHLLEATRHTGIAIDRVVLTNDVPRAPTEPATTLPVDSSRYDRTIDASPCPTGCWVVLGEGWSPGWSAELGAPTLIDGGFNGWWLSPEPATATATGSAFVARWAGQRPVDIALALSAVAALGCIVLAVRGRRRRPGGVADQGEQGDVRLEARHGTSIGLRRAVAVTAAGTAATLLLVGPRGALVAFVALAGGLVVLRRALLVAWAAMAGTAVVALYVVAQTVRLQPEAGTAFLAATSDAHEPLLVAMVLLVVSISASPVDASPVDASPVDASPVDASPNDTGVDR